MEKLNVGEEGLSEITGAELMALDTTQEAGTCLARRSMLGLVGSSIKGIDARGSSENGKGGTLCNGRCSLVVSSLPAGEGGNSKSLPSSGKSTLTCRAAAGGLRPDGGFCLNTTSSLLSSVALLSSVELTLTDGSLLSVGDGGELGYCAVLNVGRPLNAVSLKEKA